MVGGAPFVNQHLLKLSYRRSLDERYKYMFKDVLKDILEAVSIGGSIFGIITGIDWLINKIKEHQKKSNRHSHSD